MSQYNFISKDFFSRCCALLSMMLGVAVALCLVHNKTPLTQETSIVIAPAIISVFLVSISLTLHFSLAGKKRTAMLFCMSAVAGSMLGLISFLVNGYALEGFGDLLNFVVMSLVALGMLAGLLLKSRSWSNVIRALSGILALIVGAINLSAGVGTILENHADFLSAELFASLGITVSAIGLLLLVDFESGFDFDNSAPYWLSGLVGAVIVVLTLTLGYETGQYEKNLIQQKVVGETKFLADHIRSELDVHMRALIRKKMRWQAQGGVPERQWRQDAENYIQQIPGLVSLQWVGNDYQVKRREGKKTKIENNYSNKLRKEFEKASEKEIHSNVHLLEFTEGGVNSLLVILPLRDAWQQEGFKVAQFDIKQLLGAAIPDVILKRYSITISSGTKEVFKVAGGEKSSQKQLTQTMELSYGNLKWQVQAWPQKDYLLLVQSYLPVVVLVFGFILAIAVSFTVVFAFQFYLLAQKFRESESKVRAIVDNTVDGIISINSEGTIESYNAACERIFGYASSEVLGKNIKMLMPDPYQSEHDRYLRNYHVTGQRKIIGVGREVEGLTKSGDTFLMELSISEIDLENKKIYTGIVRDITERKKFEEEQDRLIEKLARSNSDLDDFAYIASHDLKEPLRAIYNHSCFLLEDYEEKLDEDGVKKLNRLITLAKRMEKLIYDLLDYSRIGRDKLAVKETDLKAVIQDVRETMYDRLVEKNVVITVKDNLPVIVCDTVRVTELYRNLIVNAIKYNDSEEIHIEIGFDHLDTPAFYVKDNGIGIDKEFHDDIFRIFKRLNSEKAYGEGSGAGLTFVKKIVEQHGGKIWLSSEKGRGTTFYFTLTDGEQNDLALSG